MGRYVDSTTGVTARVNGKVRRQYDRSDFGVNGTLRRQDGRSDGGNTWGGT